MVREQVVAWWELAEGAPGREAYLRYKEGKVRQIMTLPETELFRVSWDAAV